MSRAKKERVLHGLVGKDIDLIDLDDRKKNTRATLTFGYMDKAGCFVCQLPGDQAEKDNPSQGFYAVTNSESPARRLFRRELRFAPGKDVPRVMTRRLEDVNHDARYGLNPIYNRDQTA